MPILGQMLMHVKPFFPKYISVSKTKWYPYIDGLVQGRHNSIANALEWHFSCINPQYVIYVQIKGVPM